MRLYVITSRLKKNQYFAAAAHIWLGGYPNQNGKMLRLHFFEPLCPREDKMSIKKLFHF